ncbi:MAG: hypothetical protein Kow00106_04880 [Anaerolineae bacterium]
MNNFPSFDQPPALNFVQRWNTYLALVTAAIVLALGLTMRNTALTATQPFENLEAGVRAQVPRGWLIDTSGPDFVIRAQDPDALPFKTLLQISVLPIGPDATPNKVLDLLTMQRAARLPAYRELLRADQTLRGEPAKRMEYVYTQDERNPFQATVSLVVQGVDVVVLRRGQAVIITYREERSAFDDNLYRFENLLQTVEIF